MLSDLFIDSNYTYSKSKMTDLDGRMLLRHSLQQEIRVLLKCTHSPRQKLIKKSLNINHLKKNFFIITYYIFIIKKNPNIHYLNQEIT